MFLNVFHKCFTLLSACNTYTLHIPQLLFYSQLFQPVSLIWNHIKASEIKKKISKIFWMHIKRGEYKISYIFLLGRIPKTSQTRAWLLCWFYWLTCTVCFFCCSVWMHAVYSFAVYVWIFLSGEASILVHVYVLQLTVSLCCATQVAVKSMCSFTCLQFISYCTDFPFLYLNMLCSSFVNTAHLVSHTYISYNSKSCTFTVYIYTYITVFCNKSFYGCGTFPPQRSSGVCHIEEPLIWSRNLCHFFA